MPVFTGSDCSTLGINPIIIGRIAAEELWLHLRCADIIQKPHNQIQLACILTDTGVYSYTAQRRADDIVESWLVAAVNGMSANSSVARFCFIFHCSLGLIVMAVVRVLYIVAER